MSTDASIVTSCGFSVCGSSAAMAVTDCIKSDIDIAKVLIMFMSVITIPFIPLVPLFGDKVCGFNGETIGAWIGGSVDSTGAVFASANLLSHVPHVMDVAIIIKMLQNLIIGFICLVLAGIWFKSCKPMMLWDKFPKFVLGFILISIITTVLPEKYNKEIPDNVFIISEWFSSMSFVLIGLDINLWNLKPLFTSSNAKILILYSIGQTVDTFTTLGASYLMYTTATTTAK